MLIRPQIADENSVQQQVEPSAREKSFRNEAYICKVDKGRNAFGSMIYDVVLISEIIGDIHAENINGEEYPEIKGVFGKTVHYFSGVLSDPSIDITDSKKVFNNLTLYPMISYSIAFTTSYADLIFSTVQMFIHRTKTLSRIIFKNNTNKPYGALVDVENELKFITREMDDSIAIDVCDPRYPAMYRYVPNAIPRIIRLGSQIKGSELSNIPELKINDVQIDFDKEEKMNVERNLSIRALLGTNADDYDETTDPLINKIALSQMARNIAVDFMRADIGGMEESCTLIFDNKVTMNDGLNCGFKSLVSPFNGLLPVFDINKSRFILSEFNKICKIIIGLSTPRHYRVTLNSNPYEITVRVSILEPNQFNENLYDFKGSTTIKMKKSDAITDFVTEHIHKQQAMENYYK